MCEKELIEFLASIYKSSSLAIHYFECIISQPHLTDMKATQTMSNEKLLAN